MVTLGILLVTYVLWKVWQKKETASQQKSQTSSTVCDDDASKQTDAFTVVRQASIEVSKVTGEALLEQAKQVPVLAPVAFLVGAIASSAVTAVNLKADCLEFGKVVSTLENILVRAENLESHSEVIDDVRQSLEEALALMSRMQKTDFITQVLFASGEQSRFEELKKNIEDALARLNLRASVETAALAQAKFRQSAQLKEEIANLGGLEKVQKDPSLMKTLESHLEASDALLNANVTEARKEIKAIGDDVTKTNEAISNLEATQKSLLLQHGMSMNDISLSQSQQTQKLDEMTSSFSQLQQQSELQRLQNEVLKRQVDELKSMLSDVKDCMSKFPMPAREPERMVVVNNGGFLNMNEKDIAYETLQSICMEATKKFGLTTFMNMIGGSKQYVAAGYMPSECAPPMSLGEGSGVALNLCSLSTPRKISVCQHVVHKESPVVFEGLANHPCPTGVEDLAAASKVDTELANFLVQMQNNEGFDTKDEGDELKMKIAIDFFNNAMSHPDTFFYAGVPLRVSGQVVGSFCLLGVEKPKNWKEEDIKSLESWASKASQALERQQEGMIALLCFVFWMGTLQQKD